MATYSVGWNSELALPSVLIAPHCPHYNIWIKLQPGFIFANPRLVALIAPRLSLCNMYCDGFFLQPSLQLILVMNIDLRPCLRLNKDNKAVVIVVIEA